MVLSRGRMVEENYERWLKFRVGEFSKILLTGHGRVVVVAHEMVNRVIRGLYLNLTKRESLKLKQPHRVVILLKGGREELVVL